MSGIDLAALAPEILLALASMALLMVGAYGRAGMDGALTTGMAALMAALGLWVMLGGGPVSESHFEGGFVNDGFARFAKGLILLSSAAVLALSRAYYERIGLMRYEYPALAGLATVGMMLMVSADDLLILYMGVELQSLALYVIAAFRRDSLKATEAGLKYFVLGAISSGILLYGAALTYGFAGTTRFDGIHEVIAQEELSTGLVFGLAMLCAGLAFKLSAAPFHMWTPDVYEGAPTPATLFFAAAPKVAAGALFARLLVTGFGEATEAWRQILVFISVLSMFWGAVAAIGQTNLKRLMAYSSIGHMGFALVGLAAGGQEGAASLLTYLVIYVVMTIGVFALLLCMERDGRPVTEISDLSGLSTRAPGAAMALALLLVSLAGVPPLAGFFAKYFVFVAAVEAGLTPLAFAGAIASVISAFYYWRIIKVMYFDPEGEPLDLRMTALHGGALGGAALLMAIGWLPFLNGFGVVSLSQAAAATLFP